MSTGGPQPQGKPFAVEYYYKARWGHAQEFLDLFKKNHWPVLQRQLQAGRFLAVTAAKPRYHSTEDGRWDYRVTIVFRDVLAAHEHADEESIQRELFPDQETFRREEQRRFEILLAHWDLPVEDVDLGPEDGRRLALARGPVTIGARTPGRAGAFRSPKGWGRWSVGNRRAWVRGSLSCPWPWCRSGPSWPRRAPGRTRGPRVASPS